MRLGRNAWIRGIRGLLAAATTSLALLLALPGIGYADTTPLRSEYELPVILASAPNLCGGCARQTGPTMDFSITTNASYWSVVALRSAPALDYDLRLNDANGAFLAQSIFGTGFTDYLVIDGNRRPPQTYLPQVVTYRGDTTSYTQYELEFIQPNMVLAPQQPGTPSRDLSFGEDGGYVTIRDIFLSAGQTATVTIGSVSSCPGAPTSLVNGLVFLLASDPADATTWIQHAPAATYARYPNTNSTCTGTLTYTAPRAAWYGLLFFDVGGQRAGMGVQYTVG